MSTELVKPTLDSIDVSDIDFTDLEAEYAVPEDETFSQYLILDGAPIAPESKVPILTKVLTKFLSSAGGKVVDFYLPLSDDKKTQGFAFVQFSSVAEVEKAIRSLNGKKLDVKHTLYLNKLSDIEKYALSGKIPDEFVEPKLAEFQETDYLKSWLMDDAGRDQFYMQKGEMVGVFWNKKNDPAEPAVEPRSNWTQTYMKWSPKGSYLFSVHPQGVQAWGGAEFKGLKRFIHPGVKLLDFSPNEKYLVTLSPVAITLPDEDHPSRASYPFGEKSTGHQLVIWDILSGTPVKTFPLPAHLAHAKEMTWPLIKWSYDDRYFARLGPNALAVYDTEDDCQLLDRKPIKIDDIVDFEFAPAGIQLATARKQDPLTHALAYWTPETSNQTAKVALMEVPSKRVLRTINLFQVSDVKFHWQDKAEYLAVKVDRHTKSRKTFFTNLEFFKLNERDIPVEKIELKDTVINFQWETNGDRFVTLSNADLQNANKSIPKNVITFYAAEQSSASSKNASKKWIGFKSIEGKFLNTIKFSPKGRFVALATIGGSATQGSIEFYDLDFTGEKKESESTLVSSHVKLTSTYTYSGITDMEWDPSGRFLTAWSSVWRHKIENGYKIFDLAGRLLRDELIDEFQAFGWRPRPESLLSANDKKKARKNLREFSARFEEADAMEADAVLRELILARRALLEEWTQYRAKVEQNKELYGIQDEVVKKEDFEIIEELKEEIVEETEEVVEE
ncbi:hypothetical protein WICPIJ_000438 [Wickerhamomyces pijperi]|uniref:Eukaryotic translation initiation factor 3 subunit B n=1 Tax=Wickerhamomyces pijperi TaxID=599730 RepID=A0A9P8TS24_WICPI|nr:hypothetical protein WICPIJ_000438 [Wickerhamomyces pijperi]